MVDITKIQTFAVPKNIVQLQEINTSLTNQNTELTTKSSNLIWGLVGASVIGGMIYINLKNKLDEQNNTYTR
mgnify:CR=1 FL=1|jgi:hypothetical protein